MKLDSDWINSNNIHIHKERLRIITFYISLKSMSADLYTNAKRTMYSVAGKTTAQRKQTFAKVSLLQTDMTAHQYFEQ